MPALFLHLSKAKPQSLSSMASSALAGLLRGTAPLVRALSPTRARPLPGASISQAAFGWTASPGNASRLVRRFAIAAAADQGRTSRRGGDAGGASAVGDPGDAGALSDVAVGGDRGTGSDVARRDRDRGQGYGLTRGGGGRGDRGGALSPFSFGETTMNFLVFLTCFPTMQALPLKNSNYEESLKGFRQTGRSESELSCCKGTFCHFPSLSVCTQKRKN